MTTTAQSKWRPRWRVWVLVGLALFVLLAASALLVPPPRQQIEDDLAAIAKEHGMRQSRQLEWGHGPDDVPKTIGAAIPRPPSERYVKGGMPHAQFERIMDDVKRLVNTTMRGGWSGYSGTDGTVFVGKNESQMHRRVYDWGEITVEVAYTHEDGSKESMATLAFHTKKKSLAQRVREWWQARTAPPSSSVP